MTTVPVDIPVATDARRPPARVFSFWRHRTRHGLTPDERAQLIDAQVAATRPIIGGVLFSGALLLAIVGALEAVGWVSGIGHPWWAVALAALATAAGAMMIVRLRDWRPRLALTLGCTALVGVFLSLPLPGVVAPLALRTALFHLLPIALLALMARRASILATVALVLALATLRLALHDAPAGDGTLYWLFVFTTIAFGLLLGGYRLDFAVQMFRTRARLRELATTDALTGLLNRAGWDRDAGAEYARAAAAGRPVSVAFLDIDHFKAINDGHGHATGDRVLQVLGALLRDRAAFPGPCARLGGEEFVLMVTDERAEEFEAFVELMRREFQRRALPLQATLSAGIAHRRPGETLSMQLRRADAALYRSKAAGRDRMTVADGEPVPLRAAG